VPELSSHDCNLFIYGDQIASRDHGSPSLLRHLFIESVKRYAVYLGEVDAAYNYLLILIHYIGSNRLTSLAASEELHPAPRINQNDQSLPS